MLIRNDSLMGSWPTCDHKSSRPNIQGQLEVEQILHTAILASPFEPVWSPIPSEMLMDLITDVALTLYRSIVHS